MKSAVLVFPGSNCDRDAAVAIHQITGSPAAMVWHRDTEMPKVDLIVVPGGFSYGDYLRAGAMAGSSPAMRTVAERARAGVRVLGICNGFQILTETGLLPGALMRNAGLKFVCRTVPLKVETTDSDFTRRYQPGQVIGLPVAHMDGNYTADPETLKRIEDTGRVAFRYAGAGGVAAGSSPNGAAHDIAGLLDDSGRVLGLMPHPERAVDPETGATDGRALFTGLMEALS